MAAFTARLSLVPADQQLIYTIFTEGRFLIEENAYLPEDRFNRPALYYNLSGAHPSVAQHHITHSHVAVLGCGGIGNTVAAMVAAAGVSQLTLLDDDTVELSNLTRQIMYDEEDIGRYKVEALAERVSKQASSVKITVCKERFHNEQHASLLNSADLIIVSGDSTGICYEVNTFAYRHKIPFLNIGYINDIAVWGPFVIPGETPCYRCFSSNNIADKRWADQQLLAKVGAINQDLQAPANGPLSMLASAMASLDIIKFLGKFGQIASLNRRVGLWTHDLKLDEQPYEQQASCEFCGSA